MNPRSEFSDTPAAGDNDLARLVTALLDGSIAEPEHARLADLLRTDPAARAHYHDAVELHGLLRWRHTATAASWQPGNRRTNRPTVAATSPWRSLRSVLPVAAALLLASAVVTIYFAIAAPQPVPAPPPSIDEPIAAMIDTSPDVTVTVDDQIVAPGDEMRRGVVDLSGGTAEFQLDSGATVRLHGPSRLVLHDAMNASLILGTAVVHCPAGAVGYTVELFDGVRVVDLGTEFEATVDDSGSAFVAVVSGQVRLVVDAAEGRPARSVDLDAGSAIALADRGRSVGGAIVAVRPVSYEYLSDLRPGEPDTAHRADVARDRLTDGRIGTEHHADGSWVGVYEPGSDTDTPQPAILFDLGVTRRVAAITVSYLVAPKFAITPPARAALRFGDSPDALSEPIVVQDLDADAAESTAPPADAAVHHRTIRFTPRAARYLRLDLFNTHEWTYISEVRIDAEREPAPPAAVPLDAADAKGRNPGHTPAGTSAAP